MNFFRRILLYAWPDLSLEGTPWSQSWQSVEREKFSRIARIFFVAAAAAYLAHYFIFDIPNNLQPTSAWLAFRLVATALCLLCLAFYASPLALSSRFFRWPASIAMAAGCVAQAWVTFFYSEAPWIYPFAFIFAAVLILQTSPLKSLFFSVPVSLLCFYPLLKAGVEINSLVSAALFFCLVSSVARSAYMFEIQAFIRENERDESRREVIKLGKDFEARLKSFIPRVIAERIETKIDKERMSPMNATIEVLTPQKTEVACLFSDIRGFTQGSRDVDSFLLDSVIPEVKVCSDAVEDQHGIPRKIGDLIFAYFDHEDPHVNVLRAVLAGLKLSELNQDLNETTSAVEVKRYILISCGEAIVGNVGGLNSGVEITALGPPVNFLSRLDDATKEEGLMHQLAPGDLLLSAQAADILLTMQTNVELHNICLASANVEIRDFPEVRNVSVLRPADQSSDFVLLAYDALRALKAP